ncbi:MAG: PQQ-dependent sugar dehydrogenase [Actinomycetota bacterium]
MTLRRPLAALMIAGATVLASCASDGDDDDGALPTAPATTPGTGSPEPTTPSPEAATPSPTETTPTPEPGPVEPVDFETVVTGLDVPWGLAFLDDGREALVSERNTALIKRVNASGEVTEIGTVPGVDPGGEGGLLGIALHEQWLYAYLTASDENRVIRMPFDGSSLGEPEVIIDGIPKAGIHNGGRMVFGPDGMLYIATGDSSEGGLSQEVDSLAGKILRLEPDGSVPDGNPFDGSPVWSYGHRNVQGLAFDDEGRLWASEFGQDTWDELNLIEPGANYGWPIVEGTGGGDEFTEPVVVWRPAEASPSGIAYLRDTIFVASLRGQRLWQVPVPDGEVGEPQAFAVDQFGRLRHVTPAPNGTLWVLTNNTDGRGNPREGDDRILRVRVEPS